MKFHLTTPESMQIRESMGLVKDVYDPVSTIRPPLSAYQTMLELIHRDPTLATAYDIIIDFATYRGMDFIGGTKTGRNDLRNLFDSLNWQQVQTNIFYQLCYYGDCFLEMRRNNSKTPNELWPLETTEMRIAYDMHGKVEGYVQRPFPMDGLTEQEIKKLEGTKENPNKGIFFEPDEVAHFRMKWIGSQVYSYNPNEPISTVASTALYAGNYLMNIFINMPPRYIAHLSGISKSDYNKAKLQFQSTKTNYRKVIAFSRSSDPASKLDIKKIDPPYDKTLIEIKKYLNNEMLKITRVPRTWVEESGVENRGIGESITLPFQVRIQAIHRNVIEPVVNHKILPALGYSKTPKQSDNKLRMRYNEISRKGENEILMNAGLLRDMGLKRKALVSYLDERGILGLDPTDFEEEQKKKNMELNASRAREDPNLKDMKQNLNQDGVSAISGAKMGITPPFSGGSR